MDRLGHRSIADLESGTTVVVPSITFPISELEKIVAARFYETRMLFTLLFLRQPALRIVFVTSDAVDPDIVDYYLRFLPEAEDARARLSMVSLDDPGIRPLSDKLLDHPDALARIRELAGDPDAAHLLTFNVTPAEQEVSEALGLPLYGPTADQAWLGSKSGSRQVARRAGVPVLDGDESLFGLNAVETAIARIRARRPGAEAVVVKLNNGFSGQGNVMIELDDAVSPLVSATTTFCAGEESWPTFSAKVADEGAIVEELVRRPGIVSPSVQLRIAPAGDVELVSTHDQVLGGPGAQVYLGCRFPAAPEYRAAIQDAALSIGEVLATEGVMGSFGIDFLVVPEDGLRRVYLSEINLRLGGTTHPYWMARLVTGGVYDQVQGELVAGDHVRTYVASDNIKSPALLGVTPAAVIEAVDKSGLAYDPATATGSILHLLGAVPGYGKMGTTCIADDIADAETMYEELVATVVR